MFELDEIRIENLTHGCVTDNPAPEVSFSLNSDVPDTRLTDARIEVCGRTFLCGTAQTGIPLTGLSLAPFTEYEVKIAATDNHGGTAEGSARFMTGRLGTAWRAKWITDGACQFPKKTSPAPLTFRRKFALRKPVKRALVTATALGVYELAVNGQKVGDRWFAPGFTSYQHTLLYQLYDVTELLNSENELTAVVGGGWAVGRFTYESKSQITAPRQAFLLELLLEYEDGSRAVLPTDGRWQVTEEGNYRFGDFYDGETYDATVDLDAVSWKGADVVKPRLSPTLLCDDGASVTAHEMLRPVSVVPVEGGGTIYDFGQNFAGVVCLDLSGKRGQTVTVRHAELLVDGGLCTKSLRTAKATATYICADGKQRYLPRLTYMGFRYVEIKGIAPENVEVSALALHSDFEETGTFSCSNELLNRLQSNIRWSGKSNFVDIPTDCPQRDERQGWTGDAAIFASTAVFNFDLSRFWEKWLRDMRSEQTPGGGLPHVIPKHGYSAPSVPTACWGDSCILVPWAEYLARGNRELLRRQYPAMKRFLRSVRFWASLSGPGRDRRHIWKWLFQFGDWCAPGEGIRDWMGKGKWVATAYYANSCRLVSQIAGLLGYEADAAHFRRLSGEIARAYRNVFTDGAGRLAREFQTGYVLPLYFGMTEGAETAAMAAHLDRLVRGNGGHLSTGFTGTPYLLFALADNGHADTAYHLLFQDTCPSWLYCVKAGATTMWEQWDALRPDGSVNMDNLNGSDVEGENSMVSFNHYAYGAVGDFLYRRVAGLEPLEGGYRRFAVKPLVGGGLTWAKAETKTPYGAAGCHWRIENGRFTLQVTVPVSTVCEVTLPSGKTATVSSGEHTFSEEIP